MTMPKLRFPEFAGEWKQYKIGKIGPVAMCKRVLKEQTTPTGEIPFYKIGTFGREPDAFIEMALFKAFTERYSFPKKGDILISAAGTIGRLVVFDGAPAYFQDSNIVWVANDETRVHNTFLYLCYQNVQWLTEDTTIARLYNENLRNIAVAAPSLPEQQKIAAFLGAVDAKLAALAAKRVALGRFKAGLMQKLFSQQLRFTRDGGRAFPDWQELPFEKIASRGRSAFNPQKSTDKPTLIELENIEGETGKIVGHSDLDGQVSLKSIFRADDVLFGKLRPYLRKYARPNFDGVCSSEIWVLRGRKVSNAFLFYLVQSSLFIQVANISTGSKMPRSDWATIADTGFEIPHPDEQAKIANALSAMDAKIRAVADQIAGLEAFKKGLLQQMFV